jgi:hypothetical protein
MTDILTTFAAPTGLDWQGIAIDRSQAAGTSLNLATISRGGGGVAPVTSRWSAAQGGAGEAALVIDGMLVNHWSVATWRALQYSLQIRINHLNGAGGPCGNIGPTSDAFALDMLISADAAFTLGANTGVFLMQWAGSVGAIVLPGSASPFGLGFTFNANASAVRAWTSKGGLGATSAIGPIAALHRCLLTISSARLGTPATYAMSVDGILLQNGTLQSAVGADYTVAGGAMVPIVSADTFGDLYVADLTVLNTAPGLL